VPTYYSIGHLCVPGGDTKSPGANTSSPTTKSPKTATCLPAPNWPSQRSLYDISGDKMKLILDFPTVGEPHYANAMPASLIKEKSVKFYKLEENNHPYVAKGEGQAKVVREGNKYTCT
jgi:nitrous-oxide reductase